MLPGMDAPLIPLRFTNWATRRVLEGCRPLAPQELGRTFDLGWGSVRQTVLHMISSDMYWTDRLLGRGERDVPEDTHRDASVEAMLAMHAAASAELYEVARRLVEEGKLDAPVKLLYAEYGGHSVRVASVLAHVVNHGSHHRAHVRAMLRQLGHPIAADLDPVEWDLAGEH
jgi:uncharacterized damage-inducible protein DinB